MGGTSGRPKHACRRTQEFERPRLCATRDGAPIRAIDSVFALVWCQIRSLRRHIELLETQSFGIAIASRSFPCLRPLLLPADLAVPNRLPPVPRP